MLHFSVVYMLAPVQQGSSRVPKLDLMPYSRFSEISEKKVKNFWKNQIF